MACWLAVIVSIFDTVAVKAESVRQANPGEQTITYTIESIELYVRETKPGRMLFSLGKSGGAGGKSKPLTSPLGHVRMMLRDDRGRTAFGCSADRLSVRWLDKRPGRDQDLKRRELVDLIYAARDVYLAEPSFDDPFAQWLRCHKQIMALGRSRDQEDLTSSFASALLERAMLDGVCRLAGKSLYEMVRDDRLGFRPGKVHPELAGQRLRDWLPPEPVTRFRIRHTVGLSDPLTDADLPTDQRVNDGLPETLAEYVKSDGLTAFKVKICGKPERDLARLGDIWRVVPHGPETIVTLDANEAYKDVAPLTEFVTLLRERLPQLFDRIIYIEQPLARGLTLDRSTEPAIRRLAKLKPLVIDEADGTLDAFKRAHAIGYAGTSCKNCKGLFKSLLNRSLVAHYNARGERTFVTAEDLQNLPIVPLHQDFVALSILGVEHCERNGHHYNYGLSMLTDREKAHVGKRHRDLYRRGEDEWFLNIRKGRVHCDSLQCPGFGVCSEPPWSSMADMRAWVRERHGEGG